MTDELKPCPFCGKQPHINFARNVWCKNPLCFMSDGNDRWGFAPIDLWNTRPIEDELRAEIERLIAEIAEKNRLLDNVGEYIKDKTRGI